jgi:glycosyltransferase involved in cell wall biosynthesis
MKVYLRLPVVADCGVGYYRQWLPLFIARENKALDFICHEFTWGKRGDKDGVPTEPSIEEIKKGAEWADVLYFARNDVPQYLAEAGGLRDFFKDSYNIYKPLILDIDDNVHATRPYNPGYRSFHPNSPNLVWNIKSLGVFDYITVSTQELYDFYKNYTDKEKIFICPNSLDWEERDKIYSEFKGEKFPKKEGEIRIGWTGSGAHWENLKHIEEAIVDILKKYPETTFYCSNLFGDLFQDKELKDRIVKVGWSDLKDWAKFNREVDFDIALAPLMDNDFNRAKSNLRILEYSSARYPVICSPVSPYLGFTDKELIYATEDYEWYNGIEKLVKKPDLRKVMSKNLYQKCKKEFNIRKNYKLWVKVFEKALSNIK